MKIAPGVRLGPYEIVAPLGAGGMGEVYRARDTRLDRSVAIKVLPSALAQNPQLRLRFEREARAISALTHPHICTLHDVGTHDGIDFLVMEHLDGESLADRLGRGPLPLDETIRYGIEIADALDKAHRRGIVHRDLKPGNIMITKNGGAKLLDFGLARTIETAPPDPQSATAVAGTEHKPLTEEGTILGTMQYMAPEQLDSQPADARTDIFAFGAVLYEMLTGQRAFSGKTRSSLIAAIVATEPPPVATLQPLTPEPLERIIRICLLKDPDERWQSAHDVKLELQGLTSAAAQARVRTPSKRAWAGWIAAALIAAGAIGWYDFHRAQHRPARSVQFAIAPPPDSRFNATDGPVAISPDGSQLLFLLAVDEDRDTYWVRRLDSQTPTRLAGTEGGYDALWSPDGRQVAFFGSGKLKRIDLASSAVFTVTQAPDPRGGSWAGDTILFSPSPNGVIMAVSSAGGVPRAVTKLDLSRKETAHWRPVFLPDGKRFLFLARSTDPELSGVHLGSLDSTEVRRILDVETVALYAEPGYLLFANQNTLYAQRFDADEARLTGSASIVARGVSYASRFATPGFAAGGGVVAWSVRDTTGTMPIMRMTWSGAQTELPFHGNNLDLSDDSSRLAASRAEQQRGNLDIWIHDLRRSVSSRLTYDPADESGAVWSPDGKRIAYVVTTAGGENAVKIRPVGTGPEEDVVKHPNWLEVVDWSSDGRTLLAEVGSISNQSDLVTIDLVTKKMAPFVSSPFGESSARFSPDGKWIAYESTESGKPQISVQPFPPDGTKVQASTDRGQAPRWHSDGRTLSYVGARRTLTSVSVKVAANGLQIGTPTGNLALPSLDYVLLADGSGVLVAQPPANVSSPIVVVTNWSGPR